MKNILAGTAFITALLCAGVVSAQTDTVMADPPIPPQMQQGAGMMVQRPPMPPRETNRQIIERMRSGKMKMPMQGGTVRFEQHVNAVDGTTTDVIRIYRAENGTVIEDRTIQMPMNMPQNVPAQPGRPIFFRASSTISTGTPPDMMVRGVVASTVHAMPIRGTISVQGTSGTQWLHNMSFFGRGKGRVVSSTTDDGNVLFSLEQEQPPMRKFMDRMFGLFQRMTPQFDEAQRPTPIQFQEVQFDPSVEQQTDIQLKQ